jgi:hypothetical protein
MEKTIYDLMKEWENFKIPNSGLLYYLPVFPTVEEMNLIQANSMSWNFDKKESYATDANAYQEKPFGFKVNFILKD